MGNMHLRKHLQPEGATHSSDATLTILVSALCEILLDQGAPWLDHHSFRHALAAAKRISAIAQRLKTPDLVSRHVLPTTCHLLSCCMFHCPRSSMAR